MNSELLLKYRVDDERIQINVGLQYSVKLIPAGRCVSGIRTHVHTYVPTGKFLTVR